MIEIFAEREQIARFAIGTKPVIEKRPAVFVAQNTGIAGETIVPTAARAVVDDGIPCIARPLLKIGGGVPRGWYLTSNPTIVADWTQSTNERWLLPIGGGGGRSFTIGKQAIDSNFTFYWNAVRPTNPFSPKWQLNLEFTFLFPGNLLQRRLSGSRDTLVRERVSEVKLGAVCFGHPASPRTLGPLG